MDAGGRTASGTAVEEHDYTDVGVRVAPGAVTELPEQLHRLFATLLQMYQALPAPLRGALTMIGAELDCTREDPMWCMDLINQAIAQVQPPATND